MKTSIDPLAKTRHPSYTAAQALEASTEYFNGDDLAASTFVNKYALRDSRMQTTADGDAPSNFVELTPDNMHERLAESMARKDTEYHLKARIAPLDGIPSEGAEFFEYRKSAYLDSFLRFKNIVPQGSPMYGVGNPYVRVSLSNCVVVQSPPDNISGIFETCKELANLFKRRCGVGLSLDTLRPENAPVSNSAGTSTGAWSFAEIYSATCRQIGQNGRRGALMITMDVRHPDIMRFIMMKRDLTKVTGANISVMLTDDFMNAVENDEDWICRWPIEDDPEDIMASGGKWSSVKHVEGDSLSFPIDHKLWISSDPSEKRVLRMVKAKKLWHLINESACISAEPGLLFWDNYGNNLPAHKYQNFKLICVNPCSEIGLSAYDSCRLASINLKSFVHNAFTAEAYFDFSEFERETRLAMRVMDNIVDLEIECLENIIAHVDEHEEKALWGKLLAAAVAGRRTGLGTHGLADCLARLRLKYDSDEALEIVDRIYCLFRDSAYDESVNLAIERGPFQDFDWETEKDCLFIQRLPDALKKRMAKHGRRNISLLTMAPTGSVSIVSQTSSGIEPVFGYTYMRRKKINPSDPDARVDFVDDNGDKWAHFMVFHHNLQEFLQQQHPDHWQTWLEAEAKADKKSLNELFDLILAELVPDYFVKAGDIDAKRRVEIQGVIQRYIDHGISSTLNLPAGTSVEEVAEIYMLAWKHGLKGVTVYVDGSRSGVLVNMTKTEAAPYIPPKRPESLPCDIHRSQIDNEKWLIFVGKLNGKPYEVFGGHAEHVTIPKRVAEGRIVKRKCDKANAKGRMNCYDLVIGEGEDEWTIHDIVSTFNDGQHAHETRQLSFELRHNLPIHYIADIIGRDQDRPMYSFSKVMARVLRKYVEDGVTSGEKCAECNEKLTFEDGCFICKNCGASPKCG